MAYSTRCDRPRRLAGACRPRPSPLGPTLSRSLAGDRAEDRALAMLCGLIRTREGEALSTGPGVRSTRSMPSVLEMRSRARPLAPVGCIPPVIQPVNQGSLAPVTGAGQVGGLQALGGNIEAVMKRYNEHAKGEVAGRGGIRYRCWYEYGPSDDQKNYLNFESEWYFKVSPPSEAGATFWVKQKLLRVLIAYCPKGIEAYRVETEVNEVFPVIGNSTDPDRPDKHVDPRLYAFPCDGRSTICGMSCYELWVLSLQKSDDVTYPTDYALTDETQSWTSYDGGRTWHAPRGHEDFVREPPRGLSTVPDYIGYYIVDYHLMHCEGGGWGSTPVPVGPVGDGAMTAVAPVTGAARDVATVSDVKGVSMVDGAAVEVPAPTARPPVVGAPWSE